MRKQQWRKITWKKKLAAIGGVATMVMGVFVFFDQLDSLKDKYIGKYGEVRAAKIGWLVAPTQGIAGCIVNESARLEIERDSFAGVVTNSCFDAIKSRLDEVDSAVGEKIGSSYFLLVTNVGVPLSSIEVLDEQGGILDKVTNVDARQSVVICAGFDGKGGATSLPIRAKTIALRSGEKKALALQLPAIPERASMRGATKCGGAVFGYPTG